MNNQDFLHRPLHEADAGRRCGATKGRYDRMYIAGVGYWPVCSKRLGHDGEHQDVRLSIKAGEPVVWPQAARPDPRTLIPERVRPSR